MKVKKEQGLKIIFDTLKRANPNEDIEFYTTRVSVEVLRLLIDNEWVNQALFYQHNTRKKKNSDAFDFFRSATYDNLWQERIIRLAERVHNLWNVKNFELIIKDIISGELVSRFAEIETAGHLMTRGFDFEFNAPVGKKGEDFDIKIIAEIFINCEVKHKIESTVLSDKTIRKSLSAANKQLPHDTDALIFLKIPGEWIDNLNFREKFKSASDTFLQRNKGHILGIVLKYDKEELIKKRMMIYNLYDVIKNEHYNHNRITSKVLSRLTGPRSNLNWIDFHDFVDNNMK